MEKKQTNHDAPPFRALLEHGEDEGEDTLPHLLLGVVDAELSVIIRRVPGADLLLRFDAHSARDLSFALDRDETDGDVVVVDLDPGGFE
jgi:hypothetical protein